MGGACLFGGDGGAFVVRVVVVQRERRRFPLLQEPLPIKHSLRQCPPIVVVFEWLESRLVKQNKQGHEKARGPYLAGAGRHDRVLARRLNPALSRSAAGQGAPTSRAGRVARAEPTPLLVPTPLPRARDVLLYAVRRRGPTPPS